ncbi:hypothetical protein B0H13DRAFT_2354289 [Mycena leptocephala]|nr:hypothetical protein B0H13DRAFT_2354289 [Mycena leptocephala]
MPPHIPQELTDDILDWLVEQPKTLSQCSLVCHSWQYRAQSGLFHIIFLGVGLQGGIPCGILDMPLLGEPLDLFNRVLVDVEDASGDSKVAALWKHGVWRIEGSSCVKTFRDLLVDSPHLANHIRTLNIGLQPLQAEIFSDALCA